MIAAPLAVETHATRRANALQVLRLALELADVRCVANRPDAVIGSARDALDAALQLHRLGLWSVVLHAAGCRSPSSLCLADEYGGHYSLSPDEACAVCWYLCELPEADADDVEDAVVWAREGGRITVEAMS